MAKKVKKVKNVQKKKSVNITNNIRISNGSKATKRKQSTKKLKPVEPQRVIINGPPVPQPMAQIAGSHPNNNINSAVDVIKNQVTNYLTDNKKNLDAFKDDSKSHLDEVKRIANAQREDMNNANNLHLAELRGQRQDMNNASNIHLNEIQKQGVIYDQALKEIKNKAEEHLSSMNQTLANTAQTNKRQLGELTDKSSRHMLQIESQGQQHVSNLNNINNTLDKNFIGMNDRVNKHALQLEHQGFQFNNALQQISNKIDSSNQLQNNAFYHNGQMLNHLNNKLNDFQNNAFQTNALGKIQQQQHDIEVLKHDPRQQPKMQELADVSNYDDFLSDIPRNEVIYDHIDGFTGFNPLDNQGFHTNKLAEVNTTEENQGFHTNELAEVVPAEEPLIDYADQPNNDDTQPTNNDVSTEPTNNDVSVENYKPSDNEASVSVEDVSYTADDFDPSKYTEAYVILINKFNSMYPGWKYYTAEGIPKNNENDPKGMINADKLGQKLYITKPTYKNNLKNKTDLSEEEIEALLKKFK